MREEGGGALKGVAKNVKEEGEESWSVWPRM
jgi:hypothetical protein